MPRIVVFGTSIGALTVAALTLAVVRPAGAQARADLCGAYLLDPSSSVTFGRFGHGSHRRCPGVRLPCGADPH
jgi:hypothetical protein